MTVNVEKEIGAETLDVIVPSMLLQPLVENSIKHGLSRKVGGGRITIRAALRGGHAVIEVHDDGLGMSAERLEQALRADAGTPVNWVGTVREGPPEVVLLDAHGEPAQLEGYEHRW